MWSSNNSDAPRRNSIELVMQPIYTEFTANHLYDEARQKMYEVIEDLERQKRLMSVGYGHINFNIRMVKIYIKSLNKFEYEYKKDRLRRAAIILLGLKRRGNIRFPKRVAAMQWLGMNVNMTKYTKVPTMENIDENIMIWFAKQIFHFPIIRATDPETD